MRLRNVKNKEEILNNNSYVVKDCFQYIGNWKNEFKNDSPIHLEIGVGKADFIINSAIENPDINFVGIEKSASILALATKKIPEGLSNLRLINIDATEVEKVFSKEIETLYLNFSDPWPKKRHARRRLTSKDFLDRYEKIFKNKKIIIQKTDNSILFESSLISFSQNGYIIKDISLDLHKKEDYHNIETEYERKFSAKGNKIYMVKVEK